MPKGKSKPAKAKAPDPNREAEKAVMADVEARLGAQQTADSPGDGKELLAAARKVVPALLKVADRSQVADLTVDLLSRAAATKAHPAPGGTPEG